jgi:hypothetical protein
LAVHGGIVEWRASEVRGRLRLLLESFRPSASFRTILWCDSLDRDVLVILAIEDLFTGQSLDATLGVLIAVLCSFLVPLSWLLQIYRHVHADFVEIS